MPPSRQCACRAGPGGSPHRGGSPGTGTGRREPLAWRTGRGVRAERGAKTQASPFRPLLSPVRTGRRLVPTALLPSPPHPPPGSAPGRRGRMLGKQASQRLLETETPRDTETDTKGKVSVQSERGGRCEPAGPGSVGTGRPWPRGGGLQAGPPWARPSGLRVTPRAASSTHNGPSPYAGSWGHVNCSTSDTFLCPPSPPPADWKFLRGQRQAPTDHGTADSALPTEVALWCRAAEFLGRQGELALELGTPSPAAGMPALWPHGELPLCG